MPQKGLGILLRTRLRRTGKGWSSVFAFQAPMRDYLSSRVCKKTLKKVDNQRKMIPKRYAFVLLLFAFCNASAESDA